MAKKVQMHKIWLMQKYDNGDFYLYPWTPMLAKKDYTVLDNEEAEQYLAMQKEGKNNVRFLKDSESFDVMRTTDNKPATVKEPVKDESETEGIIDDVTNTPLAVDKIGDDEVRELSISQEGIMAKEMKFIKAARHKTTLERHMLEKYQVEIPAGQLTIMKSIANQMITDLAKENRLYLFEKDAVSRD